MKYQKIKIGSAQYNLTRPQKIDNGDSWGEIDPIKHKIKIAKHLNGDTELEVLFHECFHGLEFTQQLPSMEDDEIDRASNGVLMLLRDNLWLLRRMLKQWEQK